jgi:replicative DNA helicase
VTLGEWFESQGNAEQVAGGAYLVELASTTPSRGQHRRLRRDRPRQGGPAPADRCRHRHRQRRLPAGGPRFSAELLAKAEQEVFAIAEGRRRGRQDFVARCAAR